MKFIISFLLFILLVQNATSQNIDNSNYYKFQNNTGKTNWLRINEATPIILDELLKNGIPYHMINVGELLKINDTLRLVLTVSFRLNEKMYGFVYERNHIGALEEKHRDFLKTSSKQSYTQIETSITGKGKSTKIDSLPSNVFLLKQTCYWYQYGVKNVDYSVSKTVIENILRQDVRDYLNKL